MVCLRRMVLGILSSAVTSTVVVAQAAGKPVELGDSTHLQWSFFRITTDSITWYTSPIYGRALHGITFAESTALKQLAARQLEEVWQQAGREWWAFRDNGPAKRKAPEWQANHAIFRKLFEQFLPELRSVVPAGQQATFDQNLKVLQQADYTIVFVIDTTLPANRDNHANGSELNPIDCTTARKGRCP